MGSGETSPTMAKTHRELLARLGPSGPSERGAQGPSGPSERGAQGPSGPSERGGQGPSPVTAVVLDTPVGFQENADDVSRRAIAYFRESVQRPLEVASFRSASEVGSVAYETMLNRLREARYVFSGPGSPSYALAQWRESQVPEVLAQKLRSGGCITFASAAAVTLGALALPVYEIYKVGESPHWLPGLDLMAETGLPAVVIPHFDNAEGGTHDTRYCYMGERRLRQLEEQLPEDTFILGVDEHTACILDLGAGTCTIAGRGAVTVRRQGRSERVDAGETVPISTLGLVSGTAAAVAAGTGPPAAVAVQAGSPLLAEVQRLERDFSAGLDRSDARAAAQAILGLEDALLQWSYDTLQSDEGDRARAVLRSMVARLAEAAGTGRRDLRPVVEPMVAVLLDLRERARASGHWDDADAIRDALTAAGIEVRDTASGTTWEVRPDGSSSF